MSGRAPEAWYRPGPGVWWLAPLAAIYRLIVALRMLAYRRHWFKAYRAPAPVIVIGNITAGGTGKSPLAAEVARILAEAEYRPFIVSRGYGGKAEQHPLLVRADSPPCLTGDEPLMLHRQTGLPVVVDPQRSRGVLWALERDLGNLVICDDGLQHLALARDLELVVIDGARGVGNAFPIPQGPLREPVSRLDTVDAVVVNGAPEEAARWRARLRVPVFAMRLRPTEPQALHGHDVSPPAVGARVHAVAGIGHPERFFRTLEARGYTVIPHAFPDHHAYRREELRFTEDAPVFMTEKDAVKCAAFADLEAWVLPVRAELDPEFADFLRDRVAQLPETFHHAG